MWMGSRLWKCLKWKRRTIYGRDMMGSEEAQLPFMRWKNRTSDPDTVQNVIFVLRTVRYTLIYTDRMENSDYRTVFCNDFMRLKWKDPYFPPYFAGGALRACGPFAAVRRMSAPEGTPRRLKTCGLSLSGCRRISGKTGETSGKYPALRAGCFPSASPVLPAARLVALEKSCH